MGWGASHACSARRGGPTQLPAALDDRPLTFCMRIAPFSIFCSFSGTELFLLLQRLQAAREEVAYSRK